MHKEVSYNQVTNKKEAEKAIEEIQTLLKEAKDFRFIIRLLIYD